MDAQENLYRPPEAAVETLDETESGSFYIVSIKKFWVLYVATFGIYQWYWFYKHWSIYKERTGEKLWPVMRAIFAIFFTHSLFRKFDEEARRRGHAVDWSPGVYAGLYILVSLGSNVLERLASKGLIGEGGSFASMLAIPIVGWCFQRAQRVANLASGDPGGLENHRFTLANFIWIFLGSLIWAVVLFGVYAVLTGMPLE